MEDVRDTISALSGLVGELLTEAIQPQLIANGLTLASFELLSAIQASGPKATQVGIARRLGISAPSLTEAAKSATAHGWITQLASEQDGRTRHLRLTPKGESAVNSVLQAVNMAEQLMVQGIEPGALSTTLATLRTTSRNLAKVVEDWSEREKVPTK